jgi:AMMECR1 domain-containing protein
LEFGWDVEEFLRHLSMKAGFGPGVWKGPGVSIEFFNGEIFTESSPRGEVVRK